MGSRDSLTRLFDPDVLGPLPFSTSRTGHESEILESWEELGPDPYEEPISGSEDCESCESSSDEPWNPGEDIIVDSTDDEESYSPLNQIQKNKPIPSQALTPLEPTSYLASGSTFIGKQIFIAPPSTTPLPFPATSNSSATNPPIDPLTTSTQASRPSTVQELMASYPLPSIPVIAPPPVPNPRPNPPRSDYELLTQDRNNRMLEFSRLVSAEAREEADARISLFETIAREERAARRIAERRRERERQGEEGTFTIDMRMPEEGGRTGGRVVPGGRRRREARAVSTGSTTTGRVGGGDLRSIQDIFSGVREREILRVRRLENESTSLGIRATMERMERDRRERRQVFESAEDGGDSWEVTVHILEAPELDKRTFKGIMTATSLPQPHPLVTTSFIATILDPTNSQGIITPNGLGASLADDLRYWSELGPFKAKELKEQMKEGISDGKWLESVCEDWLLMRWKETAFVNLNPLESTLSIAGFYYIALSRATGEIEGCYFDKRSFPFQRILLSSQGLSQALGCR